MNGFDEIALKALKELREDIDNIIICMEAGDEYNSSAIGEVMMLRLFHVREALALARHYQA